MLQDVNRPMQAPVADGVNASRRRPVVVWTLVVAGLIATVAWVWLG